MDTLLKKLLMVSGVSGFEKEVAGIMLSELKKYSDSAYIDDFGNVIAVKGKGKKKIMIAAHMDEIGLVVKYITKEGFLHFVKMGGISDHVLPTQRVIVKAKKGDVLGIIGTKPPHLQKDDERGKGLKYEDMYIDIGCSSREESEKYVSVGDSVIFEPSAGVLRGDLYYGKSVDDRVGCYALIQAMKQLKSVDAEVYAVATAQEEVGLKGARTSSFKIAPDFALALDTAVAGGTPHITERDTVLKMGGGVAINMVEASGRGLIVNEKVRDLLIETAKKNKIKYQLDIVEGGMTDSAMIYMNRDGILSGTLSVPSRYLHASTGVFDINDVEAATQLTVKVIEQVAKK